MLLRENPENIHGPLSSISEDCFQGRKFDYMITNPPFGISWKLEKEFVDEEAKDPNSRFFVGTPRTSDGSFLFLQHLITKMNPEGSRMGLCLMDLPFSEGMLGVVSLKFVNGSSKMTWLECIVSLPERMFFNTNLYDLYLDCDKQKVT